VFPLEFGHDDLCDRTRMMALLVILKHASPVLQTDRETDRQL